MAPEISNDGTPYDGPPVDVFAAGAVLFLMRYAQFAFSSAHDDPFYKMLHKNPESFLEKRQLDETDPDFISLVVGMTEKDPAKRLSLQQVREHPYLNKEKASKEQVKTHFESIMPEKAKVSKEAYDAMQNQRL